MASPVSKDEHQLVILAPKVPRFVRKLLRLYRTLSVFGFLAKKEALKQWDSPLVRVTPYHQSVGAGLHAVPVPEVLPPCCGRFEI